MNKSSRIVFGLGIAAVLAGILQILPATVAGTTVEGGFFTSTGLAMIVLAWLKERPGVARHQESAGAAKESFISRFGGHLALGGLVFAGLALIGAPIIAIILKLAEEEMDLSEEAAAVVTTIKSIGDVAGPAYYAFLLGLVYFVSPKDKGP
jgi:hypothetical protein